MQRERTWQPELLPLLQPKIPLNLNHPTSRRHRHEANPVDGTEKYTRSYCRARHRTGERSVDFGNRGDFEINLPRSFVVFPRLHRPSR